MAKVNTEGKNVVTLNCRAVDLLGRSGVCTGRQAVLEPLNLRPNSQTGVQRYLRYTCTTCGNCWTVEQGGSY